jgi:predicted Zn-dependent protease
MKRLRMLGCLWGLLLAVCVLPAEALDLGETLLKSPSREQEIEIGREIAGNLLGAAPLVDDAALQTYVNQVGR